MPTESLAAPTCPKTMEYGPCGGVQLDGTCEVAAFRCVFLDRATVRWHGVRGESVGSSEAHTPAADSMAELMRARQIVVADFPARALSAASISECGGALAGHVDAVLVGDSPASRVQFSPSYRAQLIRETGLRVWSGITNRDRNRVALEGELAGLADAGVPGVHCVTGDHTLAGGRPDAKPVFELDSTETTALARAAGHFVSVGESPAAPPNDRRAARLVEKIRAGAEVCFVNHCGGAGPVEIFIEQVRELGGSVAFIPCVPVVVDRASAELLRTFTTLVLPEGYLDRILDATDVREAGISATVDLAREMMAIDGVRGVNLSGGPGTGGELAFARDLAEVADRLGMAD